MKRIKKYLETFLKMFDDAESPDEPKYDPVHVGGMIVLVLLAITVIFWLLWALLVFGGGLQSKIWPLILVIFTSKTAADFGYVGYPYQMGVFEGWPTNLIALLLVGAVASGIWYAWNYVLPQKNLKEKA
jgi:hypothetical protein